MNVIIIDLINVIILNMQPTNADILVSMFEKQFWNGDYTAHDTASDILLY
jgi:hypothetical protein